MDLARALAERLPALRTSASGPDRVAYARDLWPRHHLDVQAGRVAEHAPGLVAWPSSTEEVAALVAFAAAEGVPIVPFGAGSGVCGGVLPDARTVVVDLKRMARWRALDRDAPSLEVEAGALGIRLEEELAGEGFTAGHFPSSILCSTVGGWVAARGAGQCSGLYGKIEDMVASLECVVGRGEVVRLERRAHGPDLTPLVIGSEGVFGVVTSAKLRLHPAPAARGFGAFAFASVEAGWQAMAELFQRGLRPAVARLYDPFDTFMANMGAKKRARADEHEAKAPNALASHRIPGAGGLALRTLLRAPGAVNALVDAIGDRGLVGSQLVLVFEGDADSTRADLAAARAIARRRGATDLGEEPARHWLKKRYAVSYRQAPMFMAGAFVDTMEVAAPWSKLGGLYRAVREALGPRVFVMAHLSHAYPDGCSIYFTFAGTGRDVAAEIDTYDAAWRDALDAAIAAGGTLSHHHGVGRSKAPKLGAELGLGVDVIHALRGVFDPAGVMNPGNLVPREAPARRAPPPPPASPVVDRASFLVHAAGSATLADVERALGAEGLSLGLGAAAPPIDRTTVAAWLASGAPGAPDAWADPVHHLVAGFTAELATGAALEVRPCPRRAVGPDLYALFHGAGERVGRVTSAHLAAVASERARPLPTTLARDPADTPGERALLDRAFAAAAAVPPRGLVG
jgi:alkyldihydroxyacetonephosphate synthase